MSDEFKKLLYLKTAMDQATGAAVEYPDNFIRDVMSVRDVMPDIQRLMLEERKKSNEISRRALEAEIRQECWRLGI